MWKHFHFVHSKPIFCSLFRRPTLSSAVWYCIIGIIMFVHIEESTLWNKALMIKLKKKKSLSNPFLRIFFEIEEQVVWAVVMQWCSVSWVRRYECKVRLICQHQTVFRWNDRVASRAQHLLVPIHRHQWENPSNAPLLYTPPCICIYIQDTPLMRFSKTVYTYRYSKIAYFCFDSVCSFESVVHVYPTVAIS